MTVRVWWKGVGVRKFEVRPGCVVQAYRFALDPNAGQEAALRSHCGAARVAFNWALAHIQANWEQRTAEATYGVSEAELTPWQGWSLPALRREWNAVKERVAPWWGEHSKEAYGAGLANASAALKNWHESRTGTRRGKRVGFPRFRSKRRARVACRFTTGTIRVEADRRHVTLPRLGTIRTHESTRTLQRRVADGRARVLSATVRHEWGRWFVSFQVEVERAVRTPARPHAVVGVDLGVKSPRRPRRQCGQGPSCSGPPPPGREPDVAAVSVAAGDTAPGPGPQDRPETLPQVGEGEHGPQPGASPGGEPAHEQHSPADLGAGG